MVWYEADVREVENRVAAVAEAKNRVVFYGSSSIRLWKTLGQDFPESKTINLGFGGSTLAACAWFFERLILPVAPQSLVFYAGDNDLGDGRHPQEVYLFFCAFAEKMSRLLPGVPWYFLSIKVSPARWGLSKQIQETNALIRNELANVPDCRYVDMTTPLLAPDGKPRREFFENDGLHLNPVGYRAWQQALQQQATIF
ncbi:GDSL-type esterase/lipase family protein [Spirosoma lituiforme]